jgi:DNA-nicking Smr family endonuclease
LAEGDAVTRRKRTLTAEEKALWEHVARSVEPLKPRRVRRRKPDEAAPDAEPGAATSALAAETPVVAPPAPPKPMRKQKGAPVLEPYVVPPPPPPPAIPALQTIDRHERRKVVRGVLPIDGRIDLHGMRQAEAHQALRGFLAHAQMRGYRMVLVITGKGRSEPHFHFEEERGVLRRVVPQWLRMPDLRPFVVGFDNAHGFHGGEGALYVRLRRVGRAEEGA